ncbi:MAG TPA: hypothetical protein PL117_13850 [Accumulibacter sp.]|uniref:hypothetical protein n=1 Tax=Accumulibacter sp. TaxID=2053492 RepID=UPI0026298FEF|nr:hypothetical protein [Accumulibacter sp.]HRD92102.1 hypothetical protein [Accumulibacter sp.]HRF73849.1 hypothetical protein [Accumulibacter sp.]
MKRSAASLLLGLALAQVSICAATAAEAASTVRETPVPPAEASADISVLKGAWVRPDGGYTILIKSIGATGQIEAMYYNPSPLPFAKSEASRQGAILRAFFELRAGGYDGSTYDLSYDPASDRLSGIYYQAVAKQKFDVYFVRRR